MALRGDSKQLLGRLLDVIRQHLHDGWVSEPLAARMALLIREELKHWIQQAYPDSIPEGTTIDCDSRRRLSLSFRLAHVIPRIEVWGLSCGDEDESRLPESEHLAHSWLVLAHLGGDCPHHQAWCRLIDEAGVELVGEQDASSLSIRLWMGQIPSGDCRKCRLRAAHK